MTAWTRYSPLGSPPQVWGQHLISHGSGEIVRFTPTSVGTTGAPALGPGHRTVHPHKCGDNDLAAMGAGACAGSPPQVWGQPDSFAASVLVQRFTPTSVGTTMVIGGCARWCAVHPHKCGDNIVSALVAELELGSPPQVWGQLALLQGHLQPARFTPTSVGTTAIPLITHCTPSVHPHKCGDNWWRGYGPLDKTGSPPQVWGQRLPLCVDDPALRFTPTSVGTTPPPSTASSSSTVHPHKCGDNATARRYLREKGGSPPQVWGQRPMTAAEVPS